MKCKSKKQKIKEEENESRDSIWFTDTFFIIVLRAQSGVSLGYRNSLQ